MIKKQTDDLNRHSSKEDIQTVNIHVRISFNLREMQNQNYSEISPHASHLSEWLLSKTTTTTTTNPNNKCQQECGERVNLLHYWWECKLAQAPWNTVWKFLKKLKINLPCNPAVALLSIYLKKTITLIRKDVCIPMFIAALCIIGKIWKLPTCPSVDKLIQTVLYI